MLTFMYTVKCLVHSKYVIYNSSGLIYMTFASLSHRVPIENF